MGGRHFWDEYLDTYSMASTNMLTPARTEDAIVTSKAEPERPAKNAFITAMLRDTSFVRRVPLNQARSVPGRHLACGSMSATQILNQEMQSCGVQALGQGQDMPHDIAAAKEWARSIKRDVFALWIAARDSRTPMSAKLVAGAVAAYALSPIDLIPDFIPVIGYLDDLLIVPLGILLAVRLVPQALMREFRETASLQEGKPVSRAGLAAVILIWISVAALSTWTTYRYFYSSWELGSISPSH